MCYPVPSLPSLICPVAPVHALNKRGEHADVAWSSMEPRKGALEGERAEACQAWLASKGYAEAHLIRLPFWMVAHRWKAERKRAFDHARASLLCPTRLSPPQSTQLQTMRTASLLTAATALLAACVAASDVLDLTKDSFHTAVTPEDLMLVEFFARR